VSGSGEHEPSSGLVLQQGLDRQSTLARPCTSLSSIRNTASTGSAPILRSSRTVADYTEIRDVVEVQIWEDRDITLTLLFDPEHNLEERILKEQFVP
jgi:hypothetical protein